MFPLTHTFLLNELAEMPEFAPAANFSEFERKLYLVGGVIPDMLVPMGADRLLGHNMGRELYAFCRENYPEALPFALGVWLHGIDECGFDYYADEHWQGGNGWCFQMCEPYIPEVIKACGLPEEWGLWKAHNFIEMSCDYLCAQKRPSIGPELVAARSVPEVQDLLAEVLHKFSLADPERGVIDYDKAHKIISTIGYNFSFIDVNFADLGQKYAEHMFERHGLENADGAAVARLLERVAADIAPIFPVWYAEVKGIICTKMQQAIKELEKTQIL